MQNVLGTGDKTKSLIKKGENIINVFAKAVQDIQAVNDEIIKEQEKNNEEIKKLSSKNDSLGEAFEKNTKFASRINGLLTD